jgi:Ca-activated chloride channel family protein
MQFENPEWLWILATLPVLTLAFVFGERSASRRLAAFAAARLLPELAQRSLLPRVIRHIAMLLAVALCAIALSRPIHGYTLRDIKPRGADLIFALDVSRSMRCSDMTPDRLTRAKLAILDIIEAAPGHRTGLIPFSGTAFLQCPLTLDAEAVRQSLEALDETSIPLGGTSLAEPIAEAQKAFGQGEGEKLLVILSDGEDLEGSGLAQARSAQGIRIVTIGVGTEQGAPVPDPRSGSGYTKDAHGRPVVSRLEAGDLRAVAEATKGFYLPVDSPALAQRVANILGDKEGTGTGETSVQVPIIRYRLPLALAIAFVALEGLTPALRRRTPLAALALAMLLTPLSPQDCPAAEAGAAEALQAYNEGVVSYQNGDFAAAAEAFDKAISASGEEQTLVRDRSLANAGAARLAQALAALPGEGRPLSPEQIPAIRRLVDEARPLLEQALDRNNGDEAVRRNFRRTVELGKYLDEAEKQAEEQTQPQQEDQSQQAQPQQGQQGEQGDKSDQSGNQQSGNQQDGSSQNGNQSNRQQGQPKGQQSQQSQGAQEEQGQSAGQQQNEQASGSQQSGTQPRQADGTQSENRQSAAGQSELQQDGTQEEQSARQGAQAGNGEQAQEREKAPGMGVGEEQAEKMPQEQRQMAASEAEDKGQEQEQFQTSKGEEQKAARGIEGEPTDATYSTSALRDGEPAEARRSGESTEGLERPGEAQAQPTDSPASAHAASPARAADGAMSRDEALRILRPLGEEERILPAGELAVPRKNNTSGKDW